MCLARLEPNAVDKLLQESIGRPSKMLREALGFFLIQGILAHEGFDSGKLLYYILRILGQ